MGQPDAIQGYGKGVTARGFEFGLVGKILGCGRTIIVFNFEPGRDNV